MKGAFFWSVRRELWEHGSVLWAPLIAAACVIAAALLNVGKLQSHIGLLEKMDPARQQFAVALPFSLTASVVLFISFVVAAFYCLEALNNERRDRSILFWKSMPVSDATTVLSKFFVPLAVQPVTAFVIALATQAILLLAIGVALSVIGVDLGPLWAQLHLGPMTVAMLYGVAVHVLWYAPLYALLLLLGGWVRRPFIWFFLPLVGVQLIERIGFGTSYSGMFLRWRLMGAMGEAFAPGALKEPITSLTQLDPARFLASPGLWGGLVFAAGFIYAAILLRRSRDPN